MRGGRLKTKFVFICRWSAISELANFCSGAWQGRSQSSTGATSQTGSDSIFTFKLISLPLSFPS